MGRTDAGTGAGRARDAPPRRTPGLADLPRELFTGASADQLAGLLARAARAPAATISLLLEGSLQTCGKHGTDAVPVPDDLATRVVTAADAVIIADLSSDGGPAGAYLGQPVHDQDGAVVGVCSAYDPAPRPWTADEVAGGAMASRVATQLVTEQVARHLIDRQRRFLDAVLDSLHDGVVACDPEGHFVLINTQMFRLWGDAPVPANLDDPASVDGLLDELGRPLTHGDNVLRRALQGEHLRNERLVVQGRHRRMRHYLVDAQPIIGPDGRTQGAVAALQDVTRQRRAERFRSCELAVATALGEENTVEAAGRRVLDAVVSTLGWIHAELWLVDVPAGLTRPAAHWTAPYWQGGDIEVPPELAFGEGLAGRAWQVAKPLWLRDIGQPQSLIPLRTGGWSQLHAALAVPVQDGRDILGVLTVFADTVEDPEDELVALLAGIAAHIGQFLARRLVEDLQRQLNRSKDEYLALISHELRTPLTAISTYTELLRGADAQALAADAPAMLEVIERNTAQLRRIIDELLELSALDTGHIEMSTGPVDIAAVTAEAVAQIREETAGTDVTVSADLPEALVLPGDPVRLRQVVDHLLGNAVKYSPDGGQVSVQLSVTGGAAELTVSDTGIGVTEDERERLFDRMYRSNRARNRAIPGTGLGLSVTRAIVQRHHGTIELADHEGPGTTVVVRLPLAAR
ncbi:ATP-binding protein [Krasilnikovia sp. MM14-A1259]|uniref:ATP-binding protein n=1 Tax=Krasilnikovia sp. MM14-A1259 TaxID=3373539 RepID=UPI0037F5A8BA